MELLDTEINRISKEKLPDKHVCGCPRGPKVHPSSKVKVEGPKSTCRSSGYRSLSGTKVRVKRSVGSRSNCKVMNQDHMI